MIPADETLAGSFFFQRLLCASQNYRKVYSKISFYWTIQGGSSSIGQQV